MNEVRKWRVRNREHAFLHTRENAVVHETSNWQ